MVNMLRIVNHIGTTSGSQGNHLKFPIDVDPRGPYKNHLIVRVDTGADVNCMNEKTFRRLFPKVKLSVCTHEIQNFGNLTADISILGQFRTYLQFRGEKYLTTFIVTNADNCPDLLSHGATFRMGVLLPNYPEENVVKGETGTISNVFQILQDLHLKQYQETSSSQPRVSHTSTTKTTCITTQQMPLKTYSSTPASQNTGMATPITSMSESSTVSRTTMPADTTPSSRQPTSEIHQNSSHSGPPICCMHVHQPQSQACKPGELPALRKVKTPHNGKTSMNRSPLAKQDISSQFSGCFERIGHFPGDLCKFHLKPDHQLTKHVSKKQGISKEVNEHTDWVHSNTITTEFPNRKRVEHARHFSTPMEMCMDNHLTQTTERTQQQHLQDKTSEPSCPTHSILPDFTSRHAEFPPGMEKMSALLGNQFLQGKGKNMDTGTFTLGNIILNRYPALNTLTHQATEPGRVQQNFQQLKMESSNMEALPCFNYSAETTPQMEISKKGPGADSTQNGKGITITSSQVTPMDPIQSHTRECISTMNVHSQDSHSSKTDQLKKSKVQGNRLTRFSHHFDTDSTCDQKSMSRDLHKYWNDRETLSINLKMDTNMNTNRMTTIPMAHKEVYLLPRPLKAMAHQYRHPEKEVHLLSGPSELQPVDDGVTQYTPKGKDQDLLQPPDASEAQKPNTDPATKTRIQPIHRKRKG